MFYIIDDYLCRLLCFYLASWPFYYKQNCSCLIISHQLLFENETLNTILMPPMNGTLNCTLSSAKGTTKSEIWRSINDIIDLDWSKALKRGKFIDSPNLTSWYTIRHFVNDYRVCWSFVDFTIDYSFSKWALHIKHPTSFFHFTTFCHLSWTLWRI